MQVLVRKSDVTSADCACSVCGQGFRLYWETVTDEERVRLEREVRGAIHAQHVRGEDRTAHPEVPFTVPNWPGMPQFAGSAMLGGGFRRPAKTAEDLRKAS